MDEHAFPPTGFLWLGSAVRYIKKTLFFVWCFEISEGVLRNQKIMIGSDSFSKFIIGKDSFFERRVHTADQINPIKPRIMRSWVDQA